jgi:hypothetical protein
MKMFRILVKIDDKCYNCKARTKKPNNTGHRKDGRGNEEGVIPNQTSDIVKES